MTKKQWIYRKPPPVKPFVSKQTGEIILKECDDFIRNILKPKWIKKPLSKPKYNYVIDIFNKRRRSYFYLVAKYYCPSKNRISETFERPFARLELTKNNNFNLSYMRHTDQWWEIFQKLTLKQCFNKISKMWHFEL